jgi:hypothetical protein
MKSTPYPVTFNRDRLNQFFGTLCAVVALLLGARGRHAHAVTSAMSVRTVALTGQPVPGTPSGVVFRDFNPFYFSLNAAGQVAFLGTFFDPNGSGINEGIWSEAWPWWPARVNTRPTQMNS